MNITNERIQIFHKISDIVEGALLQRGIEVHLCGKVQRPCGGPDISHDQVDQPLYKAVSTAVEGILSTLELAVASARDEAKKELQSDLRELLGVPEPEEVDYDSY